MDVTLAGATFRLPVRIRPDLPPGVAGLPYGVPPLTWIASAAAGKDREDEMTSPYPILSVSRHPDRRSDHRGRFLIWVERRLLALWQDRYGPNRAGPFGLLQVLADSIKIFMKEDWIPPFADQPVFILAPAVSS